MMATCARDGCVKSVFVTPEGLAFAHCGRTCASLALQAIPRCSRAGCTNPKYSDGNNQYDYCGKTCAMLVIRSSAPACANSGCNQRAYINMGNRTEKYSYCTQACFWQESNSLTATKLHPLTKDNVDYVKLQTEFLKTIPSGKIQGIIRLTMPNTLVQGHLTYAQQKTPSSTPGRAQPRRRMFHGTSIGCRNPLRLLNAGGKLCSGSCGMCGIARDGNRGRFSNHGGTMWFGPDAQTSLYYAQRGAGSGSLLCMFTIDIVTTNPPGIVTVDADTATLPRYLILFKAQ